MQLILDHLSATIIGSSVILILLTVQFRSSEAAADQTNYYALKAKTNTLIELFDADFGNAGLGVIDPDSIFAEVSDTAFAFHRKLDPLAIVTAEIRYELTPSDTVQIDGTPVPMYQIRRYVDGTFAGGGPTTVTQFMVDLRDDTGTSVAQPGDATNIYVQLSVAFPIKDGDANLTESPWSRTFFPPNLKPFGS